jgi:hypothetical protein
MGEEGYFIRSDLRTRLQEEEWLARASQVDATVSINQVILYDTHFFPFEKSHRSYIMLAPAPTVFIFSLFVYFALSASTEGYDQSIQTDIRISSPNYTPAYLTITHSHRHVRIVIYKHALSLYSSPPPPPPPICAAFLALQMSSTRSKRQAACSDCQYLLL